MPLMDGYEAAEKIRKAEADNEHVVIIAMTANHIEKNRRQAFNNNFDDLLLKPYELSTICQLMNKHLEIQCVDITNNTKKVNN